MKKQIFKIASLTLVLGMASTARLAQASDVVDNVFSKLPPQIYQPAADDSGCDNDKCVIPICDPIRGCTTPSLQPDDSPLQFKESNTLTCVDPNGCSALATTPDDEVEVPDSGSENILTDTDTDTTGNVGTGTTIGSENFGSAAIAGGGCSLNAIAGATVFDAGFLSLALLAGLPFCRKRK